MWKGTATPPGSQDFRFVAFEKHPPAASFARTVADDGVTRLVRISRVPLPVLPRTQRMRDALRTWAAWRLAEALSGEGVR